MLAKIAITAAAFVVAGIAYMLARLFDDIQKEEGRKHRW